MIFDGTGVPVALNYLSIIVFVLLVAPALIVLIRR